jgi:hypothetical protein
VLEKIEPIEESRKSWDIVNEMGVTEAKIQTVEDIYRLVRTAVVSKRRFEPSMTAASGGSARTDWAGLAKGRLKCFVISIAGRSVSGLQAAGSPANWRCIAVEKLSRVELLEDMWHTAPNHTRPQTCVAEVDVDAED